MKSNFIPQILNAVAEHMGVDIDTPWKEYSREVKEAFLYGIGESIEVHYHTRDGRHTHWMYRWDGFVRLVEEK